MSHGMMRANSKDNSKRRFSGGGPRPDNNKLKREDAELRQAEWAKLSPAQQLQSLDARFGNGKGAVKQRARIKALIDKPKGNVVAKTDESIKKVAVEKAKDRRDRERTERPAK